MINIYKKSFISKPTKKSWQKSMNTVKKGKARKISLSKILSEQPVSIQPSLRIDFQLNLQDKMKKLFTKLSFLFALIPPINLKSFFSYNNNILGISAGLFCKSPSIVTIVLYLEFSIPILIH